jgi:hypothetical protein
MEPSPFPENDCPEWVARISHKITNQLPEKQQKPRFRVTDPCCLRFLLRTSSLHCLENLEATVKGTYL